MGGPLGHRALHADRGYDRREDPFQDTEGVIRQSLEVRYVDNPTESDASRFALVVLMPDSAVMRRYRRHPSLLRLAHDFRVPRAIMRCRLQMMPVPVPGLLFGWAG